LNFIACVHLGAHCLAASCSSKHFILVALFLPFDVFHVVNTISSTRVYRMWLYK